MLSKEQNIRSIRGAITLPEDSRQAIQAAVKQLLSDILRSNQLDKGALISIFFSATDDLRSYNPAKAAREMLALHDVSMFCLQEMKLDGPLLPRCLRVLVHVQLPITQKIEHIYLAGAKQLRMDWAA